MYAFMYVCMNVCMYVCIYDVCVPPLLYWWLYLCHRLSHFPYNSCKEGLLRTRLYTHACISFPFWVSSWVSFPEQRYCQCWWYSPEQSVTGHTWGGIYSRWSYFCNTSWDGLGTSSEKYGVMVYPLLSDTGTENSEPLGKPLGCNHWLSFQVLSPVMTEWEESKLIL